MHGGLRCRLHALRDRRTVPLDARYAAGGAAEPVKRGAAAGADLLRDCAADASQRFRDAVGDGRRGAPGIGHPTGALTSKDAINARDGPTLGGYAEAICEALAKLR